MLSFNNRGLAGEMMISLNKNTLLIMCRLRAE